jgi:tetratricopeptide (TPR) repeat protein
MKRRLLIPLALVAALAATAHAQPEALKVRATSAREVEDIGAYARALDLMKSLRAQVAPDADLELAIALNEARIGQFDSAAVRLWSPRLTAALEDTMPLARRVPYFWGRESAWLNGRFDGWHWTIARARAEVALELGRWDDAVEAATIAAAAQPLSGKEWHVLATCQARAGLLAEATRNAVHAAQLDPTIPEPAYLAGVLAWRQGRRAEAAAAFREAIRRDTSWTRPAVALLRARLPVPPDTLPAECFSGLRRVAGLTTPDGPKLEQFRQMDQPAILKRKVEPEFGPDVAPATPPPPLVVSVFLDARGRPVLHDLPWLPPGVVPEAWIIAIIRALPEWEYTPAMLHGEAQPVWVTVEYQQSRP